MHKKIINYFKLVPRHVWVLVFIIAVGIFFRTYNFHDWLHFKGDSFRDAILVSHSIIDGPAFLPLLGPRAGGTQLHLGAIFYYFQYISGTIFQSTSPVVLAFPDLFLSIMAIPLFFLMLRRYFSKKISLILTAMLATCYMAVEYGRFAWNPNSTPFFTILFLYSLLKAYDSENNRQYAWLAISGGALAIASQLHFSAFLGLPIIFILFVILNWKKSKKIIFSWRSLLIFFGTIFVFYIPVIIFEVVTHGKNTFLFFDAVNGKSSNRGLWKNIVQETKMFSKYFLWIGAGVFEGKWWQELASKFLVFAGIAANLFLFKKETDEKKKRFLLLTFIFMLVYLVLYFLLAFEIEKSRFFLPLIIMPFILVGYLALLAGKTKFKKTSNFFIGIFIIALIFGNARSIMTWFSEMKESETERETSYKVLTEKDKSFWWTWGRFEKAADYMDESCQKNAVFFLMSKKTKDYDHSIEYALIQRNRNLAIELKDKFKEKYENYDRCYFYISLAKEILPDFVQQKKHDEPFFLGDMKITQWYPENALLSVSPANKDPEERDSLEKIIASKYPRLQWGDLFQ